ncbi:hypothetical protein C8R43DRAFT_1101443 [Mycena crocata]|nr:hypothetical protein C8R43DRAFT_1101443 [Mycena crocata]
MPSIARAILLAVHASSFLALTGLAPATLNALASPLPGSSPATSPSSLFAARVLSKHGDAELAPAVSPAVSSPLQPRRSTSEPIQSLRQYSSGAQADAAKMRKLRARALAGEPADAAFQQQCADVLRSYQTNFVGCQRNMVLLGQDKGLACYDKADDIETLIKNLINAHKDILESVSVLVDNLPILGPILGPIVYQIKCIVDEILDLTENITDCILNLLAPLLTALGLSAVTDLLCSLNLCIL